MVRERDGEIVERTPHHFTVDVEEYFHAAALEERVDRFGWDALESRVEASVDRLLRLLADSGVHGTFFVLGWLARRHPALVRRIADGGHEIASHGWAHRRVGELGPTGFRESARRSRRALEEITGAPVLGFRAPSFSIVPGAEWALDVLLEEGYHYDSSIFPVRRPGYGYPGAERDVHRIRRGSGCILEFPPATLRFLGLHLPAGGGAYFRVLPYGLVRSALKDADRRRRPATFYIHPWEMDPGQPRMSVSPLTRIRHYAGLSGVYGRLRRLLSEFSFRALIDTAKDATESTDATPELRLAG